MKFLVAALAALLLPLSAVAQVELAYTPLPQTFKKPLDFDAVSSQPNIVFVTEKDGRIYRYNVKSGKRSVFLDLTDRLDPSSDGGLLSIAFHPQPDSHYVYVNYTGPDDDPGPGFINYISRFTLDKRGRHAKPDSELRLLSVDQPSTLNNFGEITFGPKGYLFIATGDGGGKLDRNGDAQDINSLKGKVLRIDVNRRDAGMNYAIPYDNPYANFPYARREIWALGLRNPWRISFDERSGEMWVGERGGDLIQEINHERADSRGGRNYGWPCRSGNDQTFHAGAGCPSERIQFAAPRIAFPDDRLSDVVGGAVTGGHLYRGPIEELRGTYVFGDFYSHDLYVLRPGLAPDEDDRIEVIANTPIENLSTFGMDAKKNLYAVDYNGTIFRLDAATSTSLRSNTAELTLSLSPNPTHDRVSVSLPHILTTTNIAGELFASGGRLVRRWQKLNSTAHDGRLDLELDGLSPGLYVLRLHGRQNVASARLVVQ